MTSPIPTPPAMASAPAAAAPRKKERRAPRRADGGPALAAIGFEAEFAVVMEGEQVKPEDVFGSPANIVRAPMMHRQGKSFHLPTGGAIYFDTGVIEIATSMIEIEKGCAARAGRQLWESVDYLREELDHWERAHGREVHLHGFSAHYNVSFDLPKELLRPWRTVDRLAILLAHVIPIPVMLLATNRRSSGIGLRPRGNRIELTVDFTPDPALMIAAGTFIVAVARAVMTWPSYSLHRLEPFARQLPIVKGFHMHKHTTRRGWVARHDSYPGGNPFAADVDERLWETTAGETLSLREMGRRVVEFFRPSIEAMADNRSLELIEGVVSGRAPSLLELEDRPPTYESVGRLVRWNRMFPERMLSRSRYEEVIMRAVRREVLEVQEERLHPTGMRGWSHVVFRREKDGGRRVLSLDELLEHLPRWRAER